MIFDKTVLLPLGLDDAFALVTEPARLRRWQTVAARVDLKVGGEYRWTITPGHHASGTFTEVEPGKRVVFTWGWEQPGAPADNVSTVSVTFEPAEGGTKVRLVHEGLPTPEAAAAHAEGWNHYLDRLLAEATTGDAGADEWAAAPQDLTKLTAADATWPSCSASSTASHPRTWTVPLPAPTSIPRSCWSTWPHPWEASARRWAPR